MATVSLKNLSKQYDNKAAVLHDISLEIADGEFVVLVGPSGCGKSTLLRMLAGLETISGGELQIDGVRVNDTPPAQRGIAMVFQSYALYPHMTVYKNMAFGLKMAGTPKAEVDRRVRHAASILKIDQLLDRLPKALSGGQRQRVAIGRAIVREPRLFLFDEPLSNLDASLRVQTRLEIAKLHRDLGATMVYVTHDQVEAMTLGDKIVVMHDGHVQQAGSPLALYQQPANLFVATFIGSPKMNLLDGKVVAVQSDHLQVELAGGTTVRADVATAGVTAGDQVKLGIRAEQWSEDASQSEVFRGTVNLVEHLGEANYLYVTLSGGQEIVLRGDGNRELSLGVAIECSAPSRAFYVFDSKGQALPRLYPGNMSAASKA